MMKRIWSKMIIALSIAFTAAAFCGCASCEGSGVIPNTGESIVVGGTENGGGQTVTIDIVGAEDIYLTPQATNIDKYVAKVSATEDGRSYSVVADVSNVQFGVLGTYEVTYSYKDESVKVNVYIIGEPTITDGGISTLTVAYHEARVKIYEGLSAVDALGNELDVQLLDDGGMYSGVFLNAGNFNLTFVAIDKAGQAVQLTRSVTVQASTYTPTLAAGYNYDVKDDTFILLLQEEDYQSFIALCLNGEVIADDYYVRENNSIIFDGNYLCDTFATFEDRKGIELKLVSSYGIGTSVLDIVDEGAVSYADQELQAFAVSTIYSEKSYTIPSVTLTNSRQIGITPTYTVYKGEEVFATGNTVLFGDMGDYSLVVDLRGKKLTYNFSVAYDLGFANGTVYNNETGLNTAIKEGHEVLSYEVRYYNDNDLIFSYLKDSGDDRADLSAFLAKFKQLNTKYKYLLTVYASKQSDGSMVSQSVNFTMADATTTSILSTEEDLNNRGMYVNDSTTTSLEYSATKIDGISGAFKWVDLKNGDSALNMLRINGNYLDKLTAGSYLTFDLYITNPLTLCLFNSGIGNLLYGTCGPAISAGEGKDANAELYLYDENGDLITDSKSVLNGTKLTKQWVTVELKMLADMTNANYEGLVSYTSTLFGNDVYLANIRASENSLMTDVRDNALLANAPIDEELNDIYKDDVYNQ